MMVIASQHLSSWASPSFVIVVFLLESSSVPSVCSLSDYLAYYWMYWVFMCNRSAHLAPPSPSNTIFRQ